MKIDDDHMFHGAALMQIAEDPHFTAINALKPSRVSLDNAQYVVPVALPRGGGFRVYINRPNSRGAILGEAIVVPRNAFPCRIFG